MSALRETLGALAAEPGEWRDGQEAGEGLPDARAADVLADLLGGPLPEDVVPPWWQVAVLRTWPHAGELGADGHPLQGVGFPPFPGRRRLFAGARLHVDEPLRFGETVA